MSKIMIMLLGLALVGCTSSKVPVEETPDQFSSNLSGKGPMLQLEMIRGKAHNHPLMVIWVEDMEGNFIQTLFVAESIGKGVFRHGDSSEGFWKPGEIQRPAALPYWSHRRGIRNTQGYYLPTPENPVPDAYSGPTPPKSFILLTRLDEPQDQLFRVFFEINQTWDWNEFWTNNKYPGDEQYKSSCQPALVYGVTVDPKDPSAEYEMGILGRSHHSGADGNLYDDLHTMTTALNIVDRIVVRFPPDPENVR